MTTREGLIEWLKAAPLPVHVTMTVGSETDLLLLEGATAVRVERGTATLYRIEEVGESRVQLVTFLPATPELALRAAGL